MKKNRRITVECADGPVSVYSPCAYCWHCRGVRINARIIKTPQSQALADVKRGVTSCDVLINAAMMFNTLIQDGSAIECDDEGNAGFGGLY